MSVVTNHIRHIKEKMHIKAKQKRDDVSRFLSALIIQFISYYFQVLKCSQTISQPISIRNKTVFKPVLCLKMYNNQSQHYTLYRLRQIAEHSEAARSYREKNRDEIYARQ